MHAVFLVASILGSLIALNQVPMRAVAFCPPKAAVAQSYVAPSCAAPAPMAVPVIPSRGPSAVTRTTTTVTKERYQLARGGVRVAFGVGGGCPNGMCPAVAAPVYAAPAYGYAAPYYGYGYPGVGVGFNVGVGGGRRFRGVRVGGGGCPNGMCPGRHR